MVGGVVPIGFSGGKTQAVRVFLVQSSLVCVRRRLSSDDWRESCAQTGLTSRAEQTDDETANGRTQCLPPPSTLQSPPLLLLSLSSRCVIPRVHRQATNQGSKGKNWRARTHDDGHTHSEIQGTASHSSSGSRSHTWSHSQFSDSRTGVSCSHDPHSRLLSVLQTLRLLELSSSCLTTHPH